MVITLGPAMRNFQGEHRGRMRPTPPPTTTTTRTRTTTTTTTPTTKAGDDDDDADADANENEVQNTVCLINWSPSGYDGKTWMRKSTSRLNV